jgi:excisionase family DNA binding protein
MSIATAPPALQRWLDPQGAARYASVSLRMIWRWIEQQRLTVHRPTARKVLIDRLQLDALIEDSAEPRNSGKEAG